MTIIEKYVTFMEKIASDQSHGYSQQTRWGPDYDCSSLVISALEYAGIPAKQKGATYTGNLFQVLTGLGFKNVMKEINPTSGKGLLRGDILMYHKQGNIGHVAVYEGNGTIVHARGQRYGSPALGDQGTEIAAGCSYYNPGWQYVLRYAAGEQPAEEDEYYIGSCYVKLAEMVPENYGEQVKTVQHLLNRKGFKGKDGRQLDEDGEFGENTSYAVEQLQRRAGMTGIRFGTVSAKTWALLLK